MCQHCLPDADGYLLHPGVLDGGRIAHGLWGRRNAGRLGIITLFLLGVAGIVNTLALFWVLLVVFLQRGPISPQREELSQPDSETDRRLGIGASCAFALGPVALSWPSQSKSASLVIECCLSFTIR